MADKKKQVARKKRGLSLEPQPISDAGSGGEAWYYEERGGIGIYVAPKVEWSGVRVAFIPWRKLAASVARKGASR